MQLAAVEFARNVCHIEDAQTEEAHPDAKNKIIHSIPFNPKYQTIKATGVSMRLGTFDCAVKKGTLLWDMYEKGEAWKNAASSIASERHRHRFEFNNDYAKILEKNGFVISATSPDGFFVESIELSPELHPFFVGTQGHPEYKSSPLHPHPIFVRFIEKAMEMTQK
jgi:CTP synthase